LIASVLTSVDIDGNIGTACGGARHKVALSQGSGRWLLHVRQDARAIRDEKQFQAT
jgi:hypothetical protein